MGRVVFIARLKEIIAKYRNVIRIYNDKYLVIKDFTTFQNRYRRVAECDIKKKSLFKQFNNYYFNNIDTSNMRDGYIKRYEKVYRLEYDDPDVTVTEFLANPRRKLAKRNEAVNNQISDVSELEKLDIEKLFGDDIFGEKEELLPPDDGNY